MTRPLGAWQGVGLAVVGLGALLLVAGWMATVLPAVLAGTIVLGIGLALFLKGPDKPVVGPSWDVQCHGCGTPLDLVGFAGTCPSCGMPWQRPPR